MHLIEIITELWLPLLAALGLGWTLYRLGRATERHRQRHILSRHIRHYRAQSIFRRTFRQ